MGRPHCTVRRDNVVPQGALAELQVAACVIRIVLIVGKLGPAASALFTAAEMGWKFFSCLRLSYDFSLRSALRTAAGRGIGKAHWYCNRGKQTGATNLQAMLLIKVNQAAEL